MAGPEHGPQPHQADLPPELAAYLKDKQYVCLTQATDLGTALIVKAPGREIAGIPSRVPIGIRHELYEHLTAPVIRMVLTILDKPQNPLRLETFINVQDEQQRAEYQALAEQPQIPLLFYDEGLHRRRAITLTNTAQETVRQVTAEAKRLYLAIPPWDFDFDRAKAAVMRATDLKGL